MGPGQPFDDTRRTWEPQLAWPATVRVSQGVLVRQGIRTTKSARGGSFQRLSSTCTRLESHTKAAEYGSLLAAGRLEWHLWSDRSKPRRSAWRTSGSCRHSSSGLCRERGAGRTRTAEDGKDSLEPTRRPYPQLWWLGIVVRTSQNAPSAEIRKTIRGSRISVARCGLSREDRYAGTETDACC